MKNCSRLIAKALYHLRFGAEELMGVALMLWSIAIGWKPAT